MFAGALVFQSCEKQTTPEALEIQKPIVKDETYYANLRAYKKTDHQIAFGWFGHWTAMGPSASSSLRSIPDSMDIVSIWMGSYNLSKAQVEDMRYVQEKHGTRVTYTIFAHGIPKQFRSAGNTEATLQAYAKAMADSIAKYGYDGLDLDYEPGYGGSGPLINKDTMEVFVRALGQYLGPKSGTGKLLLIDGVPGFLNEGINKFFDYGIVQAYSANSDGILQSGSNRWMSGYKNGWDPERYIMTENFEDYWSTGGVPYRITKDGTTVTMPSLFGMAQWQPYIVEDGVNVYYRKGGCGSYHMEYEYKHDPDYKYMRRAIQIMNPAGTTPIPAGKLTDR